DRFGNWCRNCGLGGAFWGRFGLSWSLRSSSSIHSFPASRGGARENCSFKFNGLFFYAVLILLLTHSDSHRSSIRHSPRGNIQVAKVVAASCLTKEPLTTPWTFGLSLSLCLSLCLCLCLSLSLSSFSPASFHLSTISISIIPPLSLILAQHYH